MTKKKRVIEARFQFRPEYAIGEPVVDEQHRYLVDLANVLHEAVVIGKAHTIIDYAFQALQFYTSTHFEYEEAFFARIASPLLAVHRAEHLDLQRELNEMWETRDKVEMSVLGAEIQQWVEDRLLPHMIIDDRKALKGARRPAQGGKVKT
ncbi:MAG: hemerythrin family protein [Alphaproteobacteria bacterium]